MYSDIAPFYDLVKSHRDYSSEAAVVVNLIRALRPQAATLLEVACGTGNLLVELPGFDRLGLDVSASMLAVAREKLGDPVALHHGPMEDFKLPRRHLDVLLCLDGAIGYVSDDDLARTLATFAQYLSRGGLLILEPWYEPDSWQPGTVHVVHHRDDDTTVVRVSYGYPDGTIEFHNVIGTAEGIHTFDERYKFTLHTNKRS